MSSTAKRSVAIVAAVIVAAVTGVVTNIATESSSWGWWTALVTLVVLSAGLQIYLGRQPSSAGHTAVANGPGAVAIGGSSRGAIHTRVTGGISSIPNPQSAGGVRATGPGSVAVGNDADGPINTDVSDGTL